MIIERAIERAKLSSPAVKGESREHSDRASIARGSERRRLSVDEVRVVPPLQFPSATLQGGVANEHVLVQHDRSGSGLFAGAFEAYRMLRTQVLRLADTEGRRTFAVTSARPAEGKSLTSLNLALALARSALCNVFLLDFDLRKPSVFQYLGASPLVDLGRYLRGEAAVSDVLHSVGIERLAVAGATAAHEDSSELLGRAAVDELFVHILQLDPNAIVVVDLPPLLSAADPMIVIPRVASTLLVTCEARTTAEDLQRASELLTGYPVAGLVLNRSHESPQGYYGYY